MIVKSYILKTNRSRSGQARAYINKFYNYSDKKYEYALHFYKYIFFDTLQAAEQYVADNYEIIK